MKKYLKAKYPMSSPRPAFYGESPEIGERAESLRYLLLLGTMLLDNVIQLLASPLRMNWGTVEADDVDGKGLKCCHTGPRSKILKPRIPITESTFVNLWETESDRGRIYRHQRMQVRARLEQLNDW